MAESAWRRKNVGASRSKREALTFLFGVRYRRNGLVYLSPSKNAVMAALNSWGFSIWGR